MHGLARDVSERSTAIAASVRLCRQDDYDPRMMTSRAFLITVALILLLNPDTAISEAPPFSDYCERLTQKIQGKMHGFPAGNVAYCVGGFYTSRELKKHETFGLTHPFHHDLRSRGVGRTTNPTSPAETS